MTVSYGDAVDHGLMDPSEDVAAGVVEGWHDPAIRLFLSEPNTEKAITMFDVAPNDAIGDVDRRRVVVDGRRGDPRSSHVTAVSRNLGVGHTSYDLDIKDFHWVVIDNLV